MPFYLLINCEQSDGANVVPFIFSSYLKFNNHLTINSLTFLPIYGIILLEDKERA